MTVIIPVPPRTSFHCQNGPLEIPVSLINAAWNQAVAMFGFNRWENTRRMQR